jgi:hypothetical protein
MILGPCPRPDRVSNGRMSEPALENAFGSLHATNVESLRWRAIRFPPDPPDDNDGVCLDGEATVGRVRRNEHGPLGGLWSWSMTAEAPGVDSRAFACHGELPSKDEAKAAVERSYARFVDASPTSREYWLKHSAKLRERMERRPRES